MARNLHRHEKEEQKLGYKYEQWQSAKLRDLERFRTENKKIVDSYIPTITEKIRSTIKDTYKKGMGRVMGWFSKLNETTGLLLPGQADLTPGAYTNGNRPLDVNFFKMDDNRINALIDETLKPVEDSTRAITRYMDDQYRQTVLKAQIALTTGATTSQKALDGAIQDFLQKGITNITYKDGSKRAIDSYAEMALRTAAHRAFLAGQGEARKQLGITTVIVSRHDSICDLCAPWQNAILIDDVYSGGKAADGPYPLVSLAIKTGLLHPNCQHNLNTYIPGVTRIPPPINSKPLIERYGRQQRQRAIERQMRERKRLLVGLRDPEAINELKKKLAADEKRMEAVMREDSRMRRQPERERPRMTLKG